MKKKNGFTLVELLAVIVILAVVILIAVTAVIPRMNSARKNAFADEALAYIKAAKEANVEGQMGGGDGGTCFTIDYLNQNYIDKKSDSYEGFVAYDSVSDTWKAYIKSDKYMINGEGGKLSKSNVLDADELTETPAGCVGTAPICKKATTLHTELCSHTESDSYCRGDGYSEGATITYGTLVSGNNLATGDALDCDVNGDGIYDPVTERFYYLTDMNSSTAVLVYYSAVTSGEPDSTTVHNNCITPSDANTYTGPNAGIAELPTTSQWSNVSLTNTSRNITDLAGTVKLSGFSYDGKAARMLTYQEVQSGCYDGITDISNPGGLTAKCEFLAETTRFSSPANVAGIYLENAFQYTSFQGYATDRNKINCIPCQGLSSFGIKPAIEVPKSSIEL